MFPGASDEHWGCFPTQVPRSELHAGVAVEGMSHESRGFLRGTFRGSKLRWATVNKEGFAIVVREVQQVLRTASENSSDSVSSSMSPIDRAVKDLKGFFACSSIATPYEFPNMHGSCKRLMVYAHMQKAGHHRSAATLQRPKEYCCWARMGEQVRDFVEQYLHGMDSKTGEMVPRPLEASVHGRRPGEVLHFDYLHAGQSGPLGGDGLDETNGPSICR